MTKSAQSSGGRVIRALGEVAGKLSARARSSALITRFGSAAEALSAKDRDRLWQITEVLDRLTPPFRTIYDIGAFDGAWSEAFAIYSGGDVFSFEPLPEMGREVAARAARLPRIHLQPIACGTETATRVMHKDGHKTAASSLLPMTDVHRTEFPLTGKSTETSVQIAPLDTWCREHRLPAPDLVKIDVQGFELAVLAGGRETLEQARYLWIELNFEEFYAGGSTFAKSYAALEKLGFALVDLVDPIRSKSNGRLLYLDGVFRNLRPPSTP